jgi:hypothetical protein
MRNSYKIFEDKKVFKLEPFLSLKRGFSSNVEIQSKLVTLASSNAN